MTAGESFSIATVLIRKLAVFMTSHPLSPSPGAGQLERAREAALRGLEFLIRHQETFEGSAEHGRFAFVYDCQDNKVISRTTNWTTGVAIEAMLSGYGVFGDERYLEAAGRGVRYLASLQEFGPLRPKLAGAFHEETPQTPWLHPRDALTAAWALLDWAEVTKDSEAHFRARAYADWMIAHGMDGGYPRWTASFETLDAAPRWYGSFHSGGAFFFARMYSVTGDERYLQTMREILDLYNRLLLTSDGRVHVIADIEGQSPVSDHDACYGADARFVPEGWIRMHEYNDDFGALANLEAYRLTNDRGYLEAAERFLRHMIAIQHQDGGFGPTDYTVPAAGGSVLLELLAARASGSALPVEGAISRAVDYVLGLQVVRPGDPADGAFRGYDDNYQLGNRICNIRAGGYAILSLLRFCGATGPIYFPASS